jgi:hypothetical protein
VLGSMPQSQLGEWESMMNVSGYHGMPSFKVRLSCRRMWCRPLSPAEQTLSTSTAAGSAVVRSRCMCWPGWRAELWAAVPLASLHS